ncbi:2Fe-2S iron-sulfur cluster-binding protein [Psychrobacter sp. CAL346-MNA-CIBAN-0220]|uniref:flavin reductase family protein n=1 Tax=Psychrobacter sp. CAL346-MNA-CIBAN-0220 TaxID=3140457 RepID=UPI00331BDD3F
MTSGYRPELVQRAFIDFIGTKLHPFWSLTTPKLRLVARQPLSNDLIALHFASNHAFKQQVFGLQGGWQGGQHLNLTIPIDGINHQRSYSLVGLPQQSLWWHDDYHESNNESNNDVNDKYHKKQKQQGHSITIAVKPQGLVSDYLTKHAVLGSIFGSSIPSGDFTLAQADLAKKVDLTTLSNKQQPLLFIASGSGITPMLGLIMQALQGVQEVALLHYNRSPILTSYWQDLAKNYPAFTYHLINTEDSSTYLAGTRHLSAQSLLSLALPLADTQIFACGSQTFLAELYRVAAEIALPSGSVSSDHSAINASLSDSHSLRDNIIIERFGTALPELNSDGENKIEEVESKTIYLRSRQRQFDSSSTLLLGAEQAGIRMNYGCRQGICQMCRCNKISGIVKNIQTGKISSDGYESIQTCINVALTDVVLDI